VDLAAKQQCWRRTYRQRRPEKTVLYKLVADHWETFKERAHQAGHGPPQEVIDEFEGYLSCGIHAAGCLELECPDCGHSMVVAYSCKRRGFCPSCIGRRMSEVAFLHLVDNVLPEVPMRPWVFTIPYALRYRVSYDRRVA